MTGMGVAESRLAALGVHLAARGYQVDYSGSELRVVGARGEGCCSACPADTITCRVRRDDGFRYWYFTSWGEPLAQAFDVVSAAVSVQGYLPAPEG